MPPPNDRKKRQSSIIFAKGTKRHDGTNTAEGAQPNNTRDSQAWAGMMMGDMSSDDESDSDRSDIDALRSRKPEPRSQPPSSSTNNSVDSAAGARASWTSRAAAVGSRPPDTASQNPPSLKLLGLKSVKDGGIPLGGNGSRNADQPPLSPAISMRQEIERRQMEEQQKHEQQLRVEQQREAAIRNRTPSPAFEMIEEERRQMQNRNMQPLQQARPLQQNSDNLRVRSNSDYGEEAGRHGSMIDFSGTDGFGSLNNKANQMQNSHSGRGVELQDEPVRNNLPLAERSRPQPRQQASLGPPQDPFANQPTSPRTALTQELGLGTRSPSPFHGGMSNTQNQYGPPGQQRQNQQGYQVQQRNVTSPFQDPRPVQPPPRSDSASSGMHQGRHPAGPQQSYQQQDSMIGQNGEAAQRRGPPPPLSLMPGNSGGQMGNQMIAPPGPFRGGPPSPHPIPLPSPVHIPMQSDMQRNGSRPGPGPRNGGPDGYQGMLPGAQQGGPLPHQGSFSNAQGGPRNNPPARRPSLFRRSKAFLTGSNVGSNPQNSQQQQQQQQQQRRSLFRKSMALFTGRGAESGPAQQHNLDSGDGDSNAPAPRVQGFVDEKPKDRKSHYMGGGGMGDEWDYSGYGAKFWKRFSVAQHKLQAGDFADLEEKRMKVARRKKFTMFATLIGGLLIILAVVAVVIWRESTPTSDVPGAIDRSNGGSGLDQQLSSQPAAAAATQTGSASSTSTTSTARSVATQDEGTSDNSETDASEEPTKKKKHRKGKDRKKHNGNTRRAFEDDGDDGDDISMLVKRQIEKIIPTTSKSLPIEQRESIHATASMIRRRRQLVEARQN